LIVEVAEKVVSCSRDLADIETSGWEARQSSASVKFFEKIVPYRSADITRIETSVWETGQRPIQVEKSEEIVPYIRRTCPKP